MAAAPSRSFQFIGNATGLITLGPITVLTDPNFLHRGQRASLGWGLSSRRLTDPALTIDQLPPLDAILLSHLHGDHWDRVARRGLSREVPVITNPHAAHGLRRSGFPTVSLPTWSSTTLHRNGHQVTITSAPGRHATGPLRKVLPPVMGSLVDHAAPDGSRLRTYITGDTLFVDDLRAIPERFPGIDVAIVHLGGTTLPGGFVVTMDGRQGADLLDLVRPRTALPVHHSDYGVQRSPLSAFLAEARRRGHGERVRVVAPGETVPLD